MFQSEEYFFHLLHSAGNISHAVQNYVAVIIWRYLPVIFLCWCMILKNFVCTSQEIQPPPQYDTVTAGEV